MISGFYTFQNGSWSRNWLNGRIGAGNSSRWTGTAMRGSCVVPFRLQWVDYGAKDFKIDWCKGVSNIYMRDKGFSSD
ncbi:MAG: hypothetical protein ACK4VM_14230 [Bosea sp. (in: a-proteobacteria)]